MSVSKPRVFSECGVRAQKRRDPMMADYGSNLNNEQQKTQIVIYVHLLTITICNVLDGSYTAIALDGFNGFKSESNLKKLLERGRRRLEREFPASAGRKVTGGRLAGRWRDARRWLEEESRRRWRTCDDNRRLFGEENDTCFISSPLQDVNNNGELESIQQLPQQSTNIMSIMEQFSKESIRAHENYVAV
ncbi:hypothetical protein LXL04_015444 [Taraxacum kok-saghyz]